MNKHLAFTLLHCSEDLRAEMSALGRLTLHDEKGQIDDHWHAHLLLIERRKCVLFTHAKTLYSCLAIAQSQVRIAVLKSLFYDTLHKAWDAERLGSEQRAQLMLHWQAIAYARAHDRRAIGCMNEVARLYRLQISRHGGVLNCPIEQITYDINRVVANVVNESPAQTFAKRFALEFNPLLWADRAAETAVGQ